MATTDYPVYADTTFTNAAVLYSSLGSFWTSLFSEKGVIKGYTMGQAEELVQNYINLTEVVNSFSVDKVDVFHREKWLPITIKLSELNEVPFIFRKITDADAGTFGVQPELNAVGTPNYYAGETFIFGHPKTPSAVVYAANIDIAIKGVRVLADKVLSPNYVFTHGIDFELVNSVLYFNSNIFSLDIPRFAVLDTNGQFTYYQDATGKTIQDEAIVLWIYNGELNRDILFNSFGYIFGLNIENNAFYKAMLQAIVKMFIGGPKVTQIRNVAAAFMGIKPIMSVVEVIEDFYDDAVYHYVITDKNVYKYDKRYSYTSSVFKGSVLNAGDIPVNACECFDYINSGDFWRTGLVPAVAALSGDITQYPEVGFPGHLFLGTYKSALVFKNEYQTVSYNTTTELITFPVQGNAADVAEFQKTINIDNTAKKEYFGFTGATTSVSINPLDFLMNHFFKYNTALIKLNFLDDEQLTLFMNFFQIIKDCFPKHIYLMFFLDFRYDDESFPLTTTDADFVVRSSQSSTGFTGATGPTAFLNKSEYLEWVWSIDSFTGPEDGVQMLDGSTGLESPAFVNNTLTLLDFGT